jgi:hypothetical protein
VVRRIVEWDGRLVVQADRCYILDPIRALATPLTLPGVREDLDVATWANGRPVALCRADDGLHLLVRQGIGWDELELPP